MSALPRLRCAVYTRKSTEDGLEQEFNSLDAQREACESYIVSQASLGWRLLPGRYDDGGISGGTMERPALQRLLADLRDRKVDVVVVCKIDRLTRSHRRLGARHQRHRGGQRRRSIRRRSRTSPGLPRALDRRPHRNRPE